MNELEKLVNFYPITQLIALTPQPIIVIAIKAVRVWW